MTNPLLETDGLPRFDAITPAHVQPAIDALVAEAEAAVDQPPATRAAGKPIDSACRTSASLADRNRCAPSGRR